MFHKQNGKCYVCGEEGKGVKRPRLRVDHDHNTGKVRKLLCNTCNIIAGIVENKNYKLVLKYLKEHT